MMVGESPLCEIERASGAHFSKQFSSEIVQDYGDPLREYQSVLHGTGALDLCHLGKFRIVGRDRVRYLHNMLTNDIKALEPGAGCYSLLLSRQGHIESDLHVYAFADELWLECPPAGAATAFETLDRHIVGDKVTIENVSDTFAILSLQGPLSRENMEGTIGRPLTGMAPFEHCTGGSGRWVVARRDRTGCDGYDLWLPREDAAEVWSYWTTDRDIRPVGWTAHNWLRTEAGIPWYGIDMTGRSLPMEFGLESAISMTKGCYRGQEIVARVVHRGHLDRRLAGIVLDAPEVPSSGAEVTAEGSNVGAVASGTYSPRLQRPLALCVLKTAFLQPGTKVQVVEKSSIFPAEVVSLPIR